MRRSASLLRLLCLGLAFALVLAGSLAVAKDRVPPPSREAVQMSFAPIVRKAAPAVVNVYVRSRVSSPLADDPFFRRFFGERLGQPSERVQSALGSGVIVSPDGVVVTNTHVVKARGETEIRVALSDRREFDAKVVLQDEKTDVAVLKIEGEGPFPTLQLEDSDTLEVGDLVLAIGNPFGVGQTVTSGIVSGLARSEIGAAGASVFIQTDAAINPGNSGGALVDMSGKLVGINTMIFSQTGGSVGIGFAIPSNLVKIYAESALTGRKIERPWLGARLEAVTRELAETLQLDRIAGAVVMRANDNGPAARAGLAAGDVIVRVDGFDVADARSVQYRLTTRGIGSTAQLEVLRKGRPVRIELPLGAAPKPGRDDVRTLSGPHPFDGARVANLGPAVADELGLDEAAGVVIVSVQQGGGAANIGLRGGDLVLRLGRDDIASIADLERALKQRTRIWQVTLKRGERVLQFQVQG